MAIDHRRLLKDTIRGMVLDWDVPVPPAPRDPEHDATPREALEFWFAVAREVLDEQPTLPPHLAAEVERMRAELLG